MWCFTLWRHTLSFAQLNGTRAWLNLEFEFLFMLTQTAAELVCNRSETVTVLPDYDYCFHTCRKELHAGRGQTGKVWKHPWCTEGEHLPWASEQKASGITSLRDEMAWWDHFKKGLVILLLAWKCCCSSSCVWNKITIMATVQQRLSPVFKKLYINLKQ